MLSASMLFAGANISKTLRVFKHMNVCGISYQTYLKHQREIIQPAVHQLWKKEQQHIFDNVKASSNSELTVAGDGRADSPGHSAKYGSYTLLDTNINKIVHTELVTVSNSK